MNQDLDDLIKKKKQSNAASGIDWFERRDKYVAAVNDLYRQIDAILADPIAKDAVKIERRPKMLTENYIGPYFVDELILRIGSEQVMFSPAGRNIVGASGRVDVVGERDTAVLLVQTDGQWSLVKTRHPTLRLIRFDESSLNQTLKRVMD